VITTALEPPTISGPFEVSAPPVVADVNADGLADVVFVGTNDVNVILANGSQRTFAAGLGAARGRGG